MLCFDVSNGDYNITFFMMLFMVWTPITDILNHVAHDGLKITAK